MMADPVNRPRWSSERGSFIVAMIFFIFLFLIVAAMGVDMGRYFYTQQQNQNIADGATLAAAQSFNQVRSLRAIDRSRMTDAAFHHIAQRSGYDTDAYELSATFKAGDLLSDSFVDVTQAAYLGDTYIRVGMNVKYYFEPYFLPRYAFGDEFFSIQSQATAELHPVYWQSNLYDPVEPGPVQPALRYSIYSKEDIKPEDQDCFVVNGDLHSDNGYMKIEEMDDANSDNNCTDPDGDHWGMDTDGDGTPGEGHFYVDGNMEVGDPSGANDGCSGKIPDEGCLMILDNVEGHVKGDMLAEEWIDQGSVVHDGTKTTGDDAVEQVSPEILDESPEDAPDDYPGPVCEFSNSGDTEVHFQSRSDFDADADHNVNGEDCSEGGTIYVKDGDSIKLDGMKPSVSGDFTFVADGSISISGVKGSNGHFENDQFAFVSLNEWIKMEKLSGDIQMDATFYAPKEGDLTQSKLCDPVQVGCVKVEEGSGDLTINGSIVAGTLAKVENQRRFRMEWAANKDVLPNSLRVWLQRNDIPDYWEINLID